MKSKAIRKVVKAQTYPSVPSLKREGTARQTEEMAAGGRGELYVFQLTITILVALSFPACATDEVRQSAFFDSIEARYRQEYTACTGDMSFISQKTLLDWKNEMNRIAKSKEYISLLREYRQVDTGGSVLPCKVLAWNEKRREAQSRHEDTLSRELLAREEFENAENEAAGLVKSAFDVPGLPFGISKKSFLLIFKKKYAVPFNDQGNYIYVNDFAWGDRTFLTAFYFDKKSGVFCRYEIESPPVAADRVNSAVRPDAEYLSHELAVRFGEPTRRFSIGFFDIKSGVLSPYKMWGSERFDVYVGLSMSKYRYYAKAVVAAK
jgi:hypothetical protein